jgi:hypothetical protein
VQQAALCELFGAQFERTASPLLNFKRWPGCAQTRLVQLCSVERALPVNCWCLNIPSRAFNWSKARLNPPRRRERLRFENCAKKRGFFRCRTFAASVSGRQGTRVKFGRSGCANPLSACLIAGLISRRMMAGICFSSSGIRFPVRPRRGGLRSFSERFSSYEIPPEPLPSSGRLRPRSFADDSVFEAATAKLHVCR